ncbi:MAG: AMP-dependent synthetase/ligase [Actinomycetota bacterium]
MSKSCATSEVAIIESTTAPGSVSVSLNDNVVSALLTRAEAAPDHAALGYRVDTAFLTTDTAQFAREVKEMAAGIIALGLDPGTRIALFSATRPEFTLIDYAIWAAGCATVTIYETSSAEQAEWIIDDSDAEVVFCETPAHQSILSSMASRLPQCGTPYVIDDGAIDEVKALATQETRAEVDLRIRAISHDDLATLVYTSGTTGKPKGCILTHGNLIWESRQLAAMAPEVINDGHHQLMFLPLAHIWARLVQVVCITNGVTIYYSTGIPRLVEELLIVQPTWIFSVPRVFEKIYNTAKQRADADGKGAIFDHATNVAINYSVSLDAGGPGLWIRLQHSVFDRLVYAKLRAAFGGDLKYAFSGGAPLGARLGHFFRGIGLSVLEGYGLTETTAGTSQNAPGELRIGSVGRPFPGTSIRIADDGEIMIRGGQIFSGYWENDAATQQSVDADGWFHSGDLGEIDNDGYLWITGRKKEIIVTAGGKNVAPAILEDRIRAHPLVSQVVVVGDGMPFIAALVAVDTQYLPEWAAANRKANSDLEDLIDDTDLNKELQLAIDEANSAVSRAEAVRAYRILPRDLTVENGELTPTFKVRRAVVTNRYEAVIADIYTPS